jgi:hypothetical protein
MLHSAFSFCIVLFLALSASSAPLCHSLFEVDSTIRNAADFLPKIEELASIKIQIDVTKATSKQIPAAVKMLEQQYKEKLAELIFHAQGILPEAVLKMKISVEISKQQGLLHEELAQEVAQRDSLNESLLGYAQQDALAQKAIERSNERSKIQAKKPRTLIPFIMKPRGSSVVKGEIEGIDRALVDFGKLDNVHMARLELRDGFDVVVGTFIIASYLPREEYERHQLEVALQHSLAHAWSEGKIFQVKKVILVEVLEARPQLVTFPQLELKYFLHIKRLLEDVGLEAATLEGSVVTQTKNGLAKDTLVIPPSSSESSGAYVDRIPFQADLTRDILVRAKLTGESFWTHPDRRNSFRMETPVNVHLGFEDKFFKFAENYK